MVHHVNVDCFIGTGAKKTVLKMRTHSPEKIRKIHFMRHLIQNKGVPGLVLLLVCQLNEKKKECEVMNQTVANET